MKIAFVLDDSLDKPDGVQQYVLTLGSWYASQGHDVHYLVSQTERTDITNIHSLAQNVHVKFNQNRVSTPLPASRSKIRAVLRKNDFDVLHVQLPFSPFLAGRIIKEAPSSTAVIGTFHIVPYSKTEHFATTTLGLALFRTKKRFDAIYSVSQPAQLFAKTAFRIDSDILPNTINSSAFKTIKPHMAEAGIIHIIFLGRLVERKGCMYMLKALAYLHRHQQLQNISVTICGKGPLSSELKRFVKSNGLEAIVQFVGFVSEADKARYLAGADIAVFPSTGGESFGIVLLEAMAAGSKVVLAGNNIGYRSVMAERPQQLFDPSDTKSFAQLLDHYISSSKARDEAFEWQQSYVRSFDVAHVGATLLDAYQTVIAKRQKSNHNTL